MSETCHHKFCRHPEVRAAFGEPRRMAACTPMSSFEARKSAADQEAGGEGFAVEVQHGVSVLSCRKPRPVILRCALLRALKDDIGVHAAILRGSPKAARTSG